MKALRNLIILSLLLTSEHCFCQTWSVVAPVFSQTATIRFTLVAQDTCSLVVYDIVGRVVKMILSDTLLQAGSYSYVLNGDSMIARKEYILVFSYDSTRKAMAVMWEDYTAINEINNSGEFSLYPNPLTSSQPLTLSSPDMGEVTFYDDIGRQLYTTTIHAGINTITTDILHTDAGLLLYTAHLRIGETQQGNIVVIK